MQISSLSLQVITSLTKEGKHGCTNRDYISNLVTIGAGLPPLLSSARFAFENNRSWEAIFRGTILALSAVLALLCRYRPCGNRYHHLPSFITDSSQVIFRVRFEENRLMIDRARRWFRWLDIINFKFVPKRRSRKVYPFFGRVPSMYVYLGYFSIGKKGKRETWVRREVNLFTLSSF